MYQSKAISEGDEGKLEHVQLTFGEGGKEIWAPVKHSSDDEQKTYLCDLYTRCIESKKATEEKLAAKWLQPLGKKK